MGVPEHDGRALWEKLMLDGFQAGLAWITILRKRAAFRDRFAEFEPAKVARFGADEVTRLMGDAGIVRSRAKKALTRSPESGALSTALKQRGFKFVGPVIVYAWMQACGLVDDHEAQCFRRRAAA